MMKRRKRRKLPARVRAEIYKDAKQGPKDVDGLYRAMEIAFTFGYRSAYDESMNLYNHEINARRQLTPAMWQKRVYDGRRVRIETDSTTTQDPPDWSA